MHINKTKFYCQSWTLKINPAAILHKDGEENKNAINNHPNYIYQFHYTATMHVEPLSSLKPSLPHGNDIPNYISVHLYLYTTFRMKKSQFYLNSNSRT
jgi:hypothetical protein